MVAMAGAIGDGAAEHQYAAELAQWRAAFDAQFWNATTGTFTGREVDIQTVTSIALGAGVAASNATREASAVAALTTDIRNRGDHLAVGSVGQKWLFRSLTAAGDHDTALRVSTQTSYPSFGHWIASGATTCWENWSGVCDESHPGTPWPGRPGKYIAPNPPTHNHIFLCGGVGEWMYRSLGGVAPGSPGYETAVIAPQVSRHGPSGVNMSVLTVRGTVKSSWVRHDARAHGDAGAGTGTGTGRVFDMRVTVPVGVRGLIAVPLLGLGAGEVRVVEVTTGKVLWDPLLFRSTAADADADADADANADGASHSRQVQRNNDPTPSWLLGSPRLAHGRGHHQPQLHLELETGAGEFEFHVSRAKGNAEI
jgi:alpha-L-rhamnosidase